MVTKLFLIHFWTISILWEAVLSSHLDPVLAWLRNSHSYATQFNVPIYAWKNKGWSRRLKFHWSNLERQMNESCVPIFFWFWQSVSSLTFLQPSAQLSAHFPIRNDLLRLPHYSFFMILHVQNELVLPLSKENSHLSQNQNLVFNLAIKLNVKYHSVFNGCVAQLKLVPRIDFFWVRATINSRHTGIEMHCMFSNS